MFKLSRLYKCLLIIIISLFSATSIAGKLSNSECQNFLKTTHHNSGSYCNYESVKKDYRKLIGYCTFGCAFKKSCRTEYIKACDGGLKCSYGRFCAGVVHAFIESCRATKSVCSNSSN